MKAGADAVRWWAAEHDTTVLGSEAPSGSRRFLVAAHRAPGTGHRAPGTGPAVLALFTEVQRWNTDGQAYGVNSTMAPGEQPLLAVGGSGAVAIWDPATAELLCSLSVPIGALLLGLLRTRRRRAAGPGDRPAAHDVCRGAAAGRELGKHRTMVTHNESDHDRAEPWM